jgi:hypothetical protein
MNKRLTQWHPAFCSAIKLELLENKDDLEYREELGLNSKPILIDLLVITKSPDVIINNDIGKIFKGHNIFEYKSPEDKLNIDTFYKGLAYACLYKANSQKVDGIKADDITITFVRHRKPVELLEQLSKYGYRFVEYSNGIYRTYISNLKYEIQIVVTSELNRNEHVWLTSLTKNLSEQEAETLVIKVSKLSAKDDKAWADSVLQVTMQENTKVFEKLKEDEKMCEALRELMKPEIEAEKKAAVEAAVEAVTKEKDAEIAELKKQLEVYASIK